MNWIKSLVPESAASSRTVLPPRQAAAAARLAQEKGAWAEAQKHWQMVVAQEPENVGAMLQLANMYNELADYKFAYATFERARKMAPENSDTIAGLGGVCERKGDWILAARHWEEVISLLLDTRQPDAQPKLKHAFRHGAMCALNAGDRNNAAEFLLRGTAAVPDFGTETAQYRLRAQMLAATEPKRAKSLLRDYLRELPDDRGAAFDFASLCLEDGDYQTGLAVFAPLLKHGDLHRDFLWLAADLNERLCRWGVCIALCQRMVAQNPAEDHLYKRLFLMQKRNNDLAGCRATACLYARRFQSVDLVHELISLYEDAGELHHARLICRLMMQAWPHSSWHQLHYITLTAATLSLSVADRQLRAYIATHGHSEEIDMIYATSAFRSGNYLEAKQRLEFYIERYPHDEDRQILLGYVLANAAGIDAAEAHFAGRAVRSFQSKGPLVGLAHMAMRKRDVQGAHQRWAHIVTLYPDDTIARVELARSAYELRRYDLARQICETQLARLPKDVTMAEFYAWLLAATGRLEKAALLIKHLQDHTGPSWAMLELAIQTASQRGRIDAEAPHLFDATPSASSFADAKRFYHVVRQLCCAGRLNLLPKALEKVNFAPKDVPWLYPYVKAANPPAALQEAWARDRALVRSDIVDFIKAATPAQVDEIVNRPAWDQPVVHVVNKFEQLSGGSELHALDVAAKLAAHTKVKLWAPEMPHPDFVKKFAVQGIEPGQGHVPNGGIIVLIGVYFDVATWIALSRPKRVIILYNTFEAPLLFKKLEEIYARTGIRAELLYCSNMMGEEVGLPGFFEPSPIDINLFSPPKTHGPPGRFVLGRHSRDVMEKHHPEDWKIYQAVAESGGQSRLLGGTCMEEVFPPLRNIDYLPARSQGIAEFLQGLDCYLYRTSTWIEPWGRVVVEAMACGVPVVAHRIGGYAQIIEHDVNGLLFDTSEQAAALIRELAHDPARRQRLGAAGRRTVEDLLGPQAIARLVSFYLADRK
jgi:glycosyltransferase involved in cell wall biosynthesis